jgi:hypothetical protein
VEISANGETVTAIVRIRRSVPRGTASMLQGTKENNANKLLAEAPTLIEITARRTANGELRTATSNA